MVVVFGGAGGSWWLGLANLGEWTGEDCHVGDTVEGSAQLYCHPITNSRGEFYYGGDPMALDPAEDTAFVDASVRDEMTYYLLDALTGDCWIGGADPTWYEDVCDTVLDITIVDGTPGEQ